MAHISLTRNVVAGFGPLAEDNRINITFETQAVFSLKVRVADLPEP